MHLQFVTKSGMHMCGIDQSMIKSYVILVRSHVVLCFDVKMVFCKEKARNTINFTVHIQNSVVHTAPHVLYAAL